MKKYDVIIVGGSCAGAAAAFELSKGGKQVLVIEKANFPRTKLCGGMITEKTISLLTDIYGCPESINAVIDSSYSSFEILHNKLGKICKCSRAGKKLYFVDRMLFDDFFLKQATMAGCEVMCGHQVTRVKHDRIIIDSGEEFFSKNIIGADGANSVVRRFVSRPMRKSHYAIGLEINIGYDRLRCFEKDGKPYPKIAFGYMNSGYGWIFPKKEFVTVGLGGLVNANQGKLLNLFRHFLRDLLIENNALPARINGFPVPFHNLVKKPGRETILLLGDAAGFVEPITGEGIYFAVLSGRLAAQSILTSPSPLDTYNSLTKEHIYPLLRQGYFMKRLFFNPVILLYAMHKMRNNAKYCKYYLDLLSGDIDYVGYVKSVLMDRNRYRSE